MNRTWVVVAYDHEGCGTVSREFRSANAAQEHALEELESNPDGYSKVLIMESSSVFINTRTQERPTFVHTGSEYVRREDANGHIGNVNVPRLGHSGS
jgi:hypothetical protein